MIREKREKLGWSRHQLADAAEIGMTTVCCIENEYRSPSLRVAKLLAEALNIKTTLADPVPSEYVLKKYPISSERAPKKRKKKAVSK